MTTLDDLVWHYWQRCERSWGCRSRSGRSSIAIGATRTRPGSGPTIRCFARAISCVATWAFAICGSAPTISNGLYLLRPGENDAPAFAHELLAEAHRLQDIFMGEFRAGLTGNELLANILARAAREHSRPEDLFPFAGPVPAPARPADRPALGARVLRRARRRRTAREHGLYDGAFGRKERARMGQRELSHGRRRGRLVLRRPLSAHSRAAENVLCFVIITGMRHDHVNINIERLRCCKWSQNQRVVFRHRTPDGRGPALVKAASQSIYKRTYSSMQSWGPNRCT